MFITDWTFRQRTIEVLALLYNQMFLNLRIINAEPAVTVFHNLNLWYLIVDLKLPSHYISSSRIFNSLESCLRIGILHKYPALAPSFFILLPDDLLDFTVFLHVVFKVYKGQASVEPTHIYYPLILPVIAFNNSSDWLLVFLPLLLLFASNCIFLLDYISTYSEPPFKHQLDAFTQFRGFGEFKMKRRVGAVFNAISWQKFLSVCNRSQRFYLQGLDVNLFGVCSLVFAWDGTQSYEAGEVTKRAHIRQRFMVQVKLWRVYITRLQEIDKSWDWWRGGFVKVLEIFQRERFLVFFFDA